MLGRRATWPHRACLAVFLVRLESMLHHCRYLCLMKAKTAEELRSCSRLDRAREASSITYQSGRSSRTANVAKKHSISEASTENGGRSASEKPRNGVAENVAILDDGGNLKGLWPDGMGPESLASRRRRTKLRQLCSWSQRRTPSTSSRATCQLSWRQPNACACAWGWWASYQKAKGEP